MMSGKYVLDEDQKQYGEFCMHHYKGIGTHRRFCPLVHYTHGANLISIIESGELWATQASCLNDEKELIHAVDLLRSAITAKQANLPNNHFSSLLEKMKERLEQPNPQAAGAFVVCFSEKANDLSQWRAYGGEEGGYAITFDPEKLLGQISNKAFLLPVLYDDKSKSVLIDDVLKWTEVFFEEGIANKRAPTVDEWAEDFLEQWLWNLSFLTPLIKHSAFEDEAEWRIIYWLRAEDASSLRFRERSTMMTRHLPIKFSDPNKDGYTPLPISEIMVGPKMHKEITRISVGDLLVSKGYGNSVEISTTDIPFRSSH